MIKINIKPAVILVAMMILTRLAAQETVSSLKTEGFTSTQDCIYATVINTTTSDLSITFKGTVVSVQEGARNIITEMLSEYKIPNSSYTGIRYCMDNSFLVEDRIAKIKGRMYIDIKHWNDRGARDYDMFTLAQSRDIFRSEADGAICVQDSPKSCVDFNIYIWDDGFFHGEGGWKIANQGADTNDIGFGAYYLAAYNLINNKKCIAYPLSILITDGRDPFQFPGLTDKSEVPFTSCGNVHLPNIVLENGPWFYKGMPSEPIYKDYDLTKNPIIESNVFVFL